MAWKWVKNNNALRYLFLSNSMLAANAVVNIIATELIDYFSRLISGEFPESEQMLFVVSDCYSLAAAVLILAMILIYERPIRRCLRQVLNGVSPESELWTLARRRVLNEPYYIILVDLFFWGLSALLFAALVWWDPQTRHLAWTMTSRSLVTGGMVAAGVFYWLEHINQHRLIPLLFPAGDIKDTPGAWRVRIGTRVGALVVSSSLIPLTAIHLTIHGSRQAVERGVVPVASMLNQVQELVLLETVLFMAAALGLAVLVTGNTARPLREMIKVLSEVGRGRFGGRVRVVSNDEIGYAGEVINQMAQGLEEREAIKDAFGKYVSRQVRDEILAGRVTLDGEYKEVTLLFSDLRDFTGLVESIPPREFILILNRYFTEMTKAITSEGGLVLQYVGDQIEAVFGAPLPLTDHPDRAVRAALAMRRSLEELNRELAGAGGPRLSHGVGVHTGQVLAAAIGSPERLSYTLVGDSVNLASRIEELNKAFGTDILVSRATRELLKQEFILRTLPPTVAKGHSHTVEVFALEQD